MPVQNTTASMRKAYERWAPIYDAIYDRLTGPAARAAVSAVERSGHRILEVGVGTGLSLPYYAPASHVHGIDLSEDMLRRAAGKAREGGWRHVKSLSVMDACRLGFEDERFDAVTAQFLITLVPDPEGALTEMARVLRPGGDLVLVNHFGQESGMLAAAEKAVASLSAKVGWSSDFKASRITAWARRQGLAVHPLEPVFPGGFFKILRMTKPA